jgi:uncharacterized protein
MSWMITASGKRIDLKLMDPAAIDIQDIAHHLAQINRYAGAAKRPYSVAEHSLLVADILAAEGYGNAPILLKAALLHDAHEAYINDLTQPCKQLIGAPWRDEELRIEGCVRHHFGVSYHFDAWGDILHWADQKALATEWHQLMPYQGQEACREAPVDWINLDDQAKFTWQDWRDAFLDRFQEYEFGGAVNV